MNRIEQIKKEIEKIDSEIAALDAAQKGIKVVANGGYGATANTSFRYFDPDISEGITLTGQMTIQFIERKINQFLNNLFNQNKPQKDFVITMDTDSVYITLKDFVDGLNETNKTKIVDALDDFIKKEIEPMLEREYTSLSKFVGAKKNLMDMKREAIGDVGIFRGKKNYVLNVFDNEGVRYNQPILKQVGIETARSSTPKIVREALSECIEIMVRKDNDALLAKIDEFKNRFMNAELYEIASPRGVSDIKKWMTNNQNVLCKKGTPIHVKAAIFYNDFIKKDLKLQNKYKMINSGDKIKFIYLREPNHFHNNAIAFLDGLPPEFGLDCFVDRETQFEKVFLNPLKSFSDLIGWQIEEVAIIEGI